MYYDADSIIHHYDGILSQDLGPRSNWIWVFDARGFGMKHISEPRVAIELAKLISRKYYSRLSKIVIINSTGWIAGAIQLVSPFLPRAFSEKLVFIHNPSQTELHPALKHTLQVIQNLREDRIVH
jgi:hypothetical protein